MPDPSHPRLEIERTALARSAVRGTGWTVGSQLTGKLLFFLSTILLARILDQEDFGVAAYAITVIALMSSLPALGLGPALIHHRDDQAVLATGFWLGVAAGIGGFALVWVTAPLAGWFFDDPRAVEVTRWLGLTFPIQALFNVNATLLRKRLEFRRRFLPELVHATTKGVVAIAMALAGFGYWSLIGGALGAAIASVPFYFRAVPWRPALHFDRGEAARLLRFGGHIVGVGVLGAIIRNLDYLLVGRLLGAATLGVYVLAFRIPDLMIRNLCVMVGQVLLPVYAKVKDDPVIVRETFVRATGYVIALTAPMAIGMALVAEPLVLTLFSERWIAVAPVIAPICFYALFVSLEYNIGDLYKAIGRPDVLTRIGVGRALVVIPALWIAADGFGSAVAVGWAQAGVALATSIVSLVVARRVFGLPVGEALLQLRPVALALAAMSLATVLALQLCEALPAAARLLIPSATGCAVYVLALWTFGREFFELGFGTVRDALQRRSPAVRSA